ncbi:MAG: glycerophosphodiester phosphodiesterase family protein [Verrucomicrobia bacterium]|nr:glycerophosphodiester phosphodiesterase family protein [Cytophagales bacterium]
MRICFKNALLILFFCSNFTAFAQHRILPKTVADLQQLLKHSPDRIPMISAHRGGPATGFPENCIETFDRTLTQIPALIECDVQLSKDQQLVMMHDDKLDRTSTGTGKINEKNWKELKKVQLKDNAGTVTDYKMPSLDEVLKWAKDKTVLTVDVKREIPPEMIVAAIAKRKAQSYAIVIAYQIDNALKYYKLDSTLSFSVNVRNAGDLERLDKSGLPYKNIFAFVGTSEPDSVIYQELHKRGISCMVGTMGNLDRRHQARQKNIYEEIIKNGADMLSTDYPKEAYESLKNTMPETSEKKKFFSKK